MFQNLVSTKKQGCTFIPNFVADKTGSLFCLDFFWFKVRVERSTPNYGFIKQVKMEERINQFVLGFLKRIKIFGLSIKVQLLS